MFYLFSSVDVEYMFLFICERSQRYVSMMSHDINLLSKVAYDYTFF